MTDYCTVLLNNLDKLHITSMGIERIKRNLCLDTTDVVKWCYDRIKDLVPRLNAKGKTGNTNIDKHHITVNAHIMSEFILPCDCYAVITVKPKFGMLWGLAVGEAKRYFYTKWLPQSDYDAQNLEYEYHTDKTVGKNPTVDIVFAITKRARGSF